MRNAKFTTGTYGLRKQEIANALAAKLSYPNIHEQPRVANEDKRYRRRDNHPPSPEITSFLRESAIICELQHHAVNL